MTCSAWLPRILILALTPGLFAPGLSAQDAAAAQSPSQDQHPEAGGVADVAVQGYYLGGISQPLTALSGMSIAFREYLPALGFLTGNLEGYVESTRGRAGLNTLTLHGLRWKERRWTITGGDFSFRTGVTPIPFTNYTYPEIWALGAKVDMTDGPRQYTLFAGEETLAEGPRITFRIQAPQSVLGAAVVQHFGNSLTIGVRYLGLSSGESQIAANPVFFPEGSTFTRTDSLSVQTSWAAGHGLTFFADTSLSHEAFAAGVVANVVPFSWLSGARWKTKRLTVTANYGRLSRSALPVVGNYFGDREGPYAEIRYKVFGTLELFGSALRSRNNLEANPDLINLVTWNVTAGANMILPGKIGLSAQYSKIGLTGQMPSDPSQNQSQHNGQSQVSLNRTISRHSLMFTARDLDLTSQTYRQKQTSGEIQDNVNFSVFTVGGSIRMQQQSGEGQLQNSVYARASGQVRIRRLLVYGQFEAGNDLINKTLFATNNVKTTVLGVEIPLINRWLAHGWTLRAEAFRTSLLSTLNPASILVLQTQATDVADILNNFNQWSFYLRLSHQTHWGAPLPNAASFTDNQVVYGAIEGFVYDDATGSHGAPGISVQLDRSRTTSTDDTGRYRFDDVPEGAHSVALNTADLDAEYSPGPPPPASTPVRPRAVARVDLRVVRAGSSIRGIVRGLTADDRGVVRLENIVIQLVPAELASNDAAPRQGGNQAGYTTCDGSGEFAFYNLTPGRYRLSVDETTLPEGYVPASAPETEIDLGSGADVPAMVFQIEKHDRVLPVRRVLDTGTR